MDYRLLIWGASGHALVVADIVESLGECEIFGFVDDVNPARAGEAFAGAKVLGGREQLALARAQGIEELVVAVGDCAARLTLSRFAREAGLRLRTLIHPSATVSKSACLGEGTVICAGAVVGAGSRLGASVLVNTCASVDHECVLNDGVHIGPGAHLGGNVRIGRGSLIGLGASVKEKVKVGERCVIGAGAVVLDNVLDGLVVVGVPAKVLQKKS